MESNHEIYKFDFRRGTAVAFPVCLGFTGGYFFKLFLLLINKVPPLNKPRYQYCIKIKVNKIEDVTQMLIGWYQINTIFNHFYILYLMNLMIFSLLKMPVRWDK